MELYQIGKQESKKVGVNKIHSKKFQVGNFMAYKPAGVIL